MRYVGVLYTIRSYHRHRLEGFRDLQMPLTYLNIILTTAYV